MPDGFTSGELEIMRGDLAGILYEASPAACKNTYSTTQSLAFGKMRAAPK